jgi:uncharacterized protein (TIGR02147 family)
MRPEVFQFNDYKSLLKSVLNSPESKRGLSRELSQAAQCQPSYFSSVINGHTHLTPDHAYGITRFFVLNEDETSYFLLLVDHARSGSPTLKARISAQLKSLKTEQENLAKRLKRPALSTDTENSVYYSTWAWSAIHILVSIPEFQDPKKIASKLKLTESYVIQVLDELERINLVKSSGKKWTYHSGSLHVPKHSPFVTTHHNNWRQQAVAHAQVFPDDGVHYTNVTSVSALAFEKLKTLVLNFIDESTRIAGPSEPEELVAITVDFFVVDR